MMRIASLSGLMLVLVLAACDQSVDDGSDSGAPDTGPVADTGPGADGVVGPDQGATDGLVADTAAGDASGAQTVKVTYKGQDKVVDLSQPTPVTFEGFPSALLSDVVALAFPGATQDSLTADFMSSDGFKPGTKTNCIGLVPVDGTLFPKGYIDVGTRKLRWDTALAYPGCLYIKDLAEIQLADK